MKSAHCEHEQGLAIGLEVDGGWLENPVRNG